MQASFKLSWNSEGANGNQYKHDVVSFDRGNITTTERSSKQVYILTMHDNCNNGSHSSWLYYVVYKLLHIVWIAI